MLTIQGYHFPEKIYEGQSSLVFRGTREIDTCPVIIKILKKEYPTARELAFFKREFEMTRDLDIEGVINVYGMERYQNSHGIVLEDFGGDAVSRYLTEGKLNVEEFLNLAIPICETLAQIHRRNVMHKDINPSNIVWNKTTGQIKIIDFGISTELTRETSAIQNPGSLEGTLVYISPEQTGRMNRAVDYRTDLYSLGASFYEMVTGSRPFAFKTATELVHAHLAQEPMPPTQVEASVPEVIEHIILKLLAKTPEDRYQTAFGIASDLRRCRESLRENGFITDFKIGQSDISTRFQIPEKLYGREKELKELLDAFERTTQGGTEMVLVSGYSGIGKSSLVREIHKPILKTSGYFISGKFDQFKRNIPYDSLIQAFRELVSQLLTEKSDSIHAWNRALRRALGPNGQVIVAVIPEVELIIGPQPDVPDLPPTESENRFNLVFENFVKTFAGPEHPLVLFLDDLQWADAPSLALLERFSADLELKNMLIIGAYRDNEVDETHPLIQRIKDIEKTNNGLNRIQLGPLALDDVNRLVSDTLYRQPEETLALAKLCLSKTNGNPFFLNQFLNALNREGCIELDTKHKTRWRWYLNRIKHHAITDNVAELMVKNIKQLPEPTQNVLTLAACIGNRFDLKTLSIVSEHHPLQCAEDLWAALEEGLILPMDDKYKYIKDVDDAKVEYRFLHDQVQQAVYSFIQDSQKRSVHLRIGRLLVANKHEQSLDEQIFDIVNHLNFGRTLIHDQEEKYKLSTLNLIAGRKAKRAAAFGPAYDYLKTGVELLEETCWQQDYDLALDLYVEAAEAAYLTADFNQMEGWTEAVLQNAVNILDKVKVYEVKILAYLSKNKPDQALITGLDALKLLNIQFPENPSKTSILWSLFQTRALLIGKKIEDLVDLPIMQDPFKLAAMRIMTGLSSAAYITAPKVFMLLALKQVRLSIRSGNANASTFSYILYGIILCGILSDIHNGFRFGRLSLSLLNKLDAHKYKARITFSFHANILHWREDAKATLKPFLEAYRAGRENGDVEFAGWAISVYIMHAFLIGRELTKLDEEIGPYRIAINSSKQKMAVTYANFCHQAVLNTIGQSNDPCILTGTSYDEELMADFHREGKDRTANFSFYFLKLCLNYLFGRYETAIEYAMKAHTFADGMAGKMHTVFFYFFDSLAHLAIAPVGQSPKGALASTLKTNHKLLRKWAKMAPINHGHKFDLVEAEMARVEGRFSDAQALYDRASTNASQYDFLFEEALTYELTARFYLGRNQTKIGSFYLHNACNAYQRWGALAKVRQLQKSFPDFTARFVTRQNHSYISMTQPISASISGKGRAETLDLVSFMKAAEALSGEIVLEKLLDKLLHIAIENAGAQRGFLFMERDGEIVVEAEAEVPSSIPSLSVRFLEEQEHQPRVLPRSILQYVRRTRKPLLLSNASAERNFIGDTYIERHNPKSVLCAPLLKQGELKAIIYLENNLTDNAFTPDRLEVLKLLSSQAAISIENARLYADLEQYNVRLEQKVSERTLALYRKNEQLLSSIRYARHIQEAIMPDPQDLHNLLPQSFIIFKPRDLVSGDFYWCSQIEDEILLAVVDCTGHGVPGALLSMMANTLLNQIVREKGVTEPAQVLFQLDAMVREALKREGRDESGDGMDLCLCRINHKEKRLSFSGSRRPLYRTRDHQLTEFKGDRKAIGGRNGKTDKPFTQQEIDILPGDCLYLSSDGFADQMNPLGKKFGSRRLKKLLCEVSKLNVISQEQTLRATLETYQAEEAQLDDIALLGLRLF